MLQDGNVIGSMRDEPYSARGADVGGRVLEAANSTRPA